MATTPIALPRLLYLGDVPVECSYHGSALLYRLLETYPADRLTVAETGITASQPERRLPSVTYKTWTVPLRRLHWTRLSGWYSVACLRGAPMRASLLARQVAALEPEAILTVAHGYSWLTAAALADRMRVPLHLICHDDWLAQGSREGRLGAWRERQFARTYRSAASRLCASPFMAETYAKRFGVDAEVLYPSRAKGPPPYAAIPDRLASEPKPFTCVFAGTINTEGYVEALKLAMRALRGAGGRLLIYGPVDPADAAAKGLAGENVEFGGMLPSSKLMDALRRRADVLFVPMSFAAADRPNMEVAFPSKLTDYTSTGLPLLIFGPRYSSVARWALANPGVSEVVTELSEQGLAEAFRRIQTDPQHRMTLAQRALAAAGAYFSHDAAFSVFRRALSGAARQGAWQ